jgi:hypothetical protein
MKTIETAKEQQKLLLPGAPDFQPPRRVRVSARYSTPPTPELGHPRIENSTKFNNGYGKMRLVGATPFTPASGGQKTIIVRKSHKRWGYVNILKQIGAQTQSGHGTTPAPLLEIRRGKWLKRG